MSASATRIRERQTSPVARAEAGRAELRRSVEPSRFERRVSLAVQPGVQRSSHAAIARISSLSQLRPQRATRISSPSDPAEREAVSTARQVMRMAQPQAAQGAARRNHGGARGAAVGPMFHRMGHAGAQREAPGSVRISRAHSDFIHRAAAEPSSADAGVMQQIEASTIGGTPLPEDVREFMEPRFNADFGGVRLHTDDSAARLSARVSARAFAYRNHIFFGRGQYQPNTAEGAELLAHELTHTIQQRAVVQRDTAQRDVAQRDVVQRAETAVETVAIQQREPTLLQRLGLSDILDGLADLAANVPGYTLLTLILGRNPINMRAVERNATNLLRAFMGLIPGGEILFQVLQSYGVIRRMGEWVQTQSAAMGLTFQGIRDAFTRFTDSLGLSDLFSPSGVWRRAQDIFAPTITRIRTFVTGLISQAITWLKETFTQPLANFCREIPGYGLVKVMLGRDPFTSAPEPRTPITVMRAVAEFIPEGTEKVNQLVESRALDRAYEWFITETQARNLTWARVTGTIAQAWDSLRLEDVLHPIDTLQRMINLFRPLLTDLVGFAGAALMKLLELIFAAAMGAGGNRIVAIFMRARATFNTIIADPVQFLRYLLGAVEQGVRQFKNNILTHLRNGVIAWLTGPVARAGIQMPEQWDLRGVIWFVLQILGLTWPNIRTKLVRLMGDRPVALLEGGFQLLQEIRERGLVQALRDRVTEFFGQMRETALGAIKNFIQQRLVMAGIQQLISLLSPVGAVIQAIIKTYNTIKFFIDKINEILDLVESIVDSIAAIAAGRIAAAANLVERTMARTIPVILDFLARFIGLGDVGSQVQSTIRGIQGRVDQMLDRAVDWIRRQAANLASRALGGDANATPQQRVASGVREGIQAINRLSGSRIGIELIRPVLAVIRVRNNLRSLDAEPENGVWVVVGVVNPRLRGPSAKNAITPVPAGPAGSFPSNVHHGSGRSITHGGVTLRVGNRMTAEPVGPDLVSIGGNHVSDGTRAELRALIGATRQGRYRVGHLLNNNIGGSGSDWLNLTPLSSSSNMNHYLQAERDVRNIVERPVSASNPTRWVFYDVVPRYGTHSLPPNGPHHPAEAQFATSLDMQWQRMEQNPSQPTRLRRTGQLHRIPLTLTLPS